jgi:hypothetical protein
VVQHYFTKALYWYNGANTDECCAAAGQAKERERWALVLADLHDKAWVSMQQTYVKNQSLVEEWEEEREGIKDGIHTALDRCAGAYVCVSM